jgi:HAE1 family hydrophobic/amphiphilic exporter-1
MTIGANGKMDEAEFYDLIGKKITPVLSRVEGVAQVNIIEVKNVKFRST